jgi:hypothetical protein
MMRERPFGKYLTSTISLFRDLEQKKKHLKNSRYTTTRSPPQKNQRNQLDLCYAMSKLLLLATMGVDCFFF